MKNGTVRYTKVGTDEVIAEYPYPNVLFALTRSRLRAAKNKSFDNDIDAMANYGALSLAEMKGNTLVELPDIKDVTPEDVLMACIDIDIEIVQPEQEDAGDVDPNPTVTKGASS